MYSGASRQPSQYNQSSSSSRRHRSTSSSQYNPLSFASSPQFTSSSYQNRSPSRRTVTNTTNAHLQPYRSSTSGLYNQFYNSSTSSAAALRQPFASTSSTAAAAYEPKYRSASAEYYRYPASYRSSRRYSTTNAQDYTSAAPPPPPPAPAVGASSRYGLTTEPSANLGRSRSPYAYYPGGRSSSRQALLGDSEYPQDGQQHTTYASTGSLQQPSYSPYAGGQQYSYDYPLDRTSSRDYYSTRYGKDYYGESSAYNSNVPYSRSQRTTLDDYYTKWPYPTSRSAFTSGGGRYSSTGSDLHYYGSQYLDSSRSRDPYSRYYSTDSIPYTRQLGPYSRESPYDTSSSYPQINQAYYYSRGYRDDPYLASSAQAREYSRSYPALDYDGYYDSRDSYSREYYSPEYKTYSRRFQSIDYPTSRDPYEVSSSYYRPSGYSAQQYHYPHQQNLSRDGRCQSAPPPLYSSDYYGTNAWPDSSAYYRDYPTTTQRDTSGNYYRERSTYYPGDSTTTGQYSAAGGHRSQSAPPYQNYPTYSDAYQTRRQLGENRYYSGQAASSVPTAGVANQQLGPTQPKLKSIMRSSRASTGYGGGGGYDTGYGYSNQSAQAGSGGQGPYSSYGAGNVYGDGTAYGGSTAAGTGYDHRSAYDRGGGYGSGTGALGHSQQQHNHPPYYGTQQSSAYQSGSSQQQHQHSSTYDHYGSSDPSTGNYPQQTQLQNGYQQQNGYAGGPSLQQTSHISNPSGGYGSVRQDPHYHTTTSSAYQQQQPQQQPAVQQQMASQQVASQSYNPYQTTSQQTSSQQQQQPTTSYQQMGIAAKAPSMAPTTTNPYATNATASSIAMKSAGAAPGAKNPFGPGGPYGLDQSNLDYYRKLYYPYDPITGEYMKDATPPGDTGPPTFGAAGPGGGLGAGAFGGGAHSHLSSQYGAVGGRAGGAASYMNGGVGGGVPGVMVPGHGYSPYGPYGDQEQDSLLLCCDFLIPRPSITCLIITLFAMLVLIIIFTVVKFTIIYPADASNAETLALVDQIVVLLLFGALISLLWIFGIYFTSRRTRRQISNLLSCTTGNQALDHTLVADYDGYVYANSTSIPGAPGSHNHTHSHQTVVGAGGRTALGSASVGARGGGGANYNYRYANNFV